jgi:hypothetical protein
MCQKNLRKINLGWWIILNRLCCQFQLFISTQRAYMTVMHTTSKESNFSPSLYIWTFIGVEQLNKEKVGNAIE